MTGDSTQRGSEDPFGVRLTWPGDRARESTAAPEEVDPEPDGPSAGDAPEHLGPASLVETTRDPIGPPRLFVDAFERMSERVLERLRALRQDVDADLTELKTELAALRHAVDDVGDRVQLRQLRSTVDDLRADVLGLRRAVLEWPELETVSSEIVSIRSDLTELLERGAGSRSGAEDPPGPAELAPVIEELAAIRRELGERPDGAELREGLAELRAEVALLRRRIALRAGDW